MTDGWLGNFWVSLEAHILNRWMGDPSICIFCYFSFEGHAWYDAACNGGYDLDDMLTHQILCYSSMANCFLHFFLMFSWLKLEQSEIGKGSQDQAPSLWHEVHYEAGQWSGHGSIIKSGLILVNAMNKKTMKLCITASFSRLTGKNQNKKEQ